MKSLSFLSIVAAVINILLVHGAHQTEHLSCNKDSDNLRKTYDSREPCVEDVNCSYGGTCIQIPKSKILFNLTADMDKRYLFEDSNELFTKKNDFKKEKNANRDMEQSVDVQMCVCKKSCKDEPAMPVCGTNGKTYKNKCLLELEACRCQKALYIQYHGECLTSTVNSATFDDEDFNWGSGSGDGEILFSVTCSTGIVCQYGAVCNPLTQESSCICDKVCPPTIFEERVYGSDGVWYHSLCLMHKAECEKQMSIFQIEDAGWHVQDKVLIDEEPTNPCDHMNCFYGAICLPDEATCSCDAICDQEFASPLPPDDNPFKFLAAYMPKPIEMMFGNPTPSLVNVDDDEHSTFTEFENKHGYHVDSFDVFSYREDTLEIIDVDETNEVSETYRKPKKVKQRRPRRRHRRKGESKQKQGKKGFVNNRQKRSFSETYPRPFINTTVCGTDGKSYARECEMRVKACHDRTRVDISHVGSCKMSPIKLTKKTEFEERSEKIKTHTTTERYPSTTPPSVTFDTNTDKRDGFVSMSENESNDTPTPTSEKDKIEKDVTDIILNSHVESTVDNSVSKEIITEFRTNNEEETKNKHEKNEIDSAKKITTAPPAGERSRHIVTEANQQKHAKLPTVTQKSGSKNYYIWVWVVAASHTAIICAVAALFCFRCRRKQGEDAEVGENGKSSEHSVASSKHNKQSKLIHFVKSTC